MKPTAQEIVASQPVPNLNGDSKETLTREWSEFSSALEKAIEKFPHASYHGRNQHVKGDEGHHQAIDVKTQLILSLKCMLNSSDEILDELTK